MVSPKHLFPRSQHRYSPPSNNPPALHQSQAHPHDFDITAAAPPPALGEDHFPFSSSSSGSNSMFELPPAQTPPIQSSPSFATFSFNYIPPASTSDGLGLVAAVNTTASNKPPSLLLRMQDGSLPSGEADEYTAMDESTEEREHFPKPLPSAGASLLSRIAGVEPLRKPSSTAKANPCIEGIDKGRSGAQLYPASTRLSKTILPSASPQSESSSSAYSASPAITPSIAPVLLPGLQLSVPSSSALAHAFIDAAVIGNNDAPMSSPVHPTLEVPPPPLSVNKISDPEAPTAALPNLLLPNPFRGTQFESPTPLQKLMDDVEREQQEWGMVRYELEMKESTKAEEERQQKEQECKRMEEEVRQRLEREQQRMREDAEQRKEKEKQQQREAVLLKTQAPQQIESPYATPPPIPQHGQQDGELARLRGLQEKDRPARESKRKADLADHPGSKSKAILAKASARQLAGMESQSSARSRQSSATPSLRPPTPSSSSRQASELARISLSPTSSTSRRQGARPVTPFRIVEVVMPPRPAWSTVPKSPANNKSSVSPSEPAAAVARSRVKREGKSYPTGAMSSDGGPPAAQPSSLRKFKQVQSSHLPLLTILPEEEPTVRRPTLPNPPPAPDHLPPPIYLPRDEAKPAPLLNRSDAAKSLASTSSAVKPEPSLSPLSPPWQTTPEHSNVGWIRPHQQPESSFVGSNHETQPPPQATGSISRPTPRASSSVTVDPRRRLQNVHSDLSTTPEAGMSQKRLQEEPPSSRLAGPPPQPPVSPQQASHHSGRVPSIAASPIAHVPLKSAVSPRAVVGRESGPSTYIEGVGDPPSLSSGHVAELAKKIYARIQSQPGVTALRATMAATSNQLSTAAGPSRYVDGTSGTSREASTIDPRPPPPTNAVTASPLPNELKSMDTPASDDTQNISPSSPSRRDFAADSAAPGVPHPGKRIRPQSPVRSSGYLSRVAKRMRTTRNHLNLNLNHSRGDRVRLDDAYRRGRYPSPEPSRPYDVVDRHYRPEPTNTRYPSPPTNARYPSPPVHPDPVAERDRTRNHNEWPSERSSRLHPRTDWDYDERPPSRYTPPLHSPTRYVAPKPMPFPGDRSHRGWYPRSPERRYYDERRKRSRSPPPRSLSRLSPHLPYDEVDFGRRRAKPYHPRSRSPDPPYLRRRSLSPPRALFPRLRSRSRSPYPRRHAETPPQPLSPPPPPYIHQRTPSGPTAKAERQLSSGRPIVPRGDRREVYDRSRSELQQPVVGAIPVGVSAAVYVPPVSSKPTLAVSAAETLTASPPFQAVEPLPKALAERFTGRAPTPAPDLASRMGVSSTTYSRDFPPKTKPAQPSLLSRMK